MLKLLSFLSTAAILIFAPSTSNSDKEYSAKLSVNEWQILISDQNDVAKNIRDRVVSKLAVQIQQQINSDTLQTKKKQ